VTRILRVTAPGIAVVAAGGSLKPYRLEGDTAHFEVSQAGFEELDQQIDDAIIFLREHKQDIDLLMALPSASGILDFGAAQKYAGAQFGRFSAELVCLAGKAGLGLELSLYPVESERAEA
jgi:hypothetical protein